MADTPTTAPLDRFALARLLEQARADLAAALTREEARTEERDRAIEQSERWAKLAYTGRDELLDALTERDRLRDALAGVRAFVRTGGPLYNADRLELLDTIVNPTLVSVPASEEER